MLSITEFFKNYNEIKNYNGSFTQNRIETDRMLNTFNELILPKFQDTVSIFSKFDFRALFDVKINNYNNYYLFLNSL